LHIFAHIQPLTATIDRLGNARGLLGMPKCRITGTPAIVMADANINGIEYAQDSAFRRGFGVFVANQAGPARRQEDCLAVEVTAA
jgi:hypothetical protein